MFRWRFIENVGDAPSKRRCASIVIRGPRAWATATTCSADAPARVDDRNCSVATLNGEDEIASKTDGGV
jgi:hypothetical protein